MSYHAGKAPYHHDNISPAESSPFILLFFLFNVSLLTSFTTSTPSSPRAFFVLFPFLHSSTSLFHVPLLSSLPVQHSLLKVQRHFPVFTVPYPVTSSTLFIFLLASSQPILFPQFYPFFLFVQFFLPHHFLFSSSPHPLTSARLLTNSSRSPRIFHQGKRS